jgi:sterol desaturase/sphingolipid hydroxylase (fatty acid hydroxylase superfamily)
MNYARIETLQIVAFVSVFAVLSALETISPFLPNPSRLQHMRRNLSLMFCNVLVDVGMRGLTAGASVYVARHGFGLLHAAELSTFKLAVVGILLLDFTNYGIHRLKHSLPVLWKFHQVHHSDSWLDVTTSLRFHPGETLITMFLQLAVVIVFGIPTWVMALYFLCLIFFILINHSNVRWPLAADRCMRSVFTSPYMHKTHHSREQSENDSNFSDIFSIWDRLFKTYRTRESYEDLVTGLKGAEGKQSFLRLLHTPLSMKR